MVQRSALSVAPDLGEIEDPPLARRQQLLAGEFGRGVQVERRPLARRVDELGGERVQVGLVAGRDLQRRGLDLDEVALFEPLPESGGDPIASEQPRPAILVDVRPPPGQGSDPRRARAAGAVPLL